MPPWRLWTVLTEVFIFYLLGLDCEGQKEVKVRRGEDATLECYDPSDATDILLRWTKDEGYVIYFKDGTFQVPLQDPSFKGRVEMKDSKWMKNGNFSVILQNVTMKDSGTYKCEAAYNNQRVLLLNSTTLKVEERGQTGGQSGDEREKSGPVGLKVGLPVSVVLLVAVVVVVGFLICKRQTGPYQSGHASRQ